MQRIISVLTCACIKNQTQTSIKTLENDMRMHIPHLILLNKRLAMLIYHIPHFIGHSFCKLLHVCL